MTIKVNGEKYSTEKETLARLLEELKIMPERVAVEVNLKVIKRADFSNFFLHEGDSVEIVYFVGGGDKFPTARLIFISYLIPEGGCRKTG